MTAAGGTSRAGRPTRREQAIRHGADLLREGGPSALTSVAVAERMGITQSAVYRHVRNIDELAQLAAEVVIDELNTVLEHLLLDPTVDWEHIDDVGRLCRRLVDAMVDNARAFATVDQWRFAGGELGAGIERIVAQGRDLVGEVLELRWRVEFGYQPDLTPNERANVLRHAQALHDDGHAIARLARSLPAHLDLDAVAAVFKYRLLAGWASFVIDMNGRVGLAFPRIDLDEGVVVD